MVRVGLLSHPPAQKDVWREVFLENRPAFSGVDFDNDSSSFTSQTSTFGRESSSGGPHVSCIFSQTSTFAPQTTFFSSCELTLKPENEIGLCSKKFPLHFVQPVDPLMN
jgi:hypothetical protein